ncbi:MAG: glycosyltransferase family 2 protein, partial [Gemmataceae bacterium]|nr:glycosyltransferase family 2 protein [Gemmataceae bacterium]
MTATLTRTPIPAPRDTRPMADHAGTLSVLIPVYNEEKYVGEIITRVLALGPVVKELVIVDDGSKDRTAEVVQARADAEPKIKFYKSPKNGGKTAAIRKALELATGDVLIVQDADLEYDPAEIPDVIAPILAGQ